jgi:hypothetical protein
MYKPFTQNEASSIRATIESVLGFVDRYTILDTGSDDNTTSIIKDSFGGIPGDVSSCQFKTCFQFYSLMFTVAPTPQIFYEPFVNFGVSRNRVLELEGEKSVFALMLSGDETLRNGHILRSYCEDHREDRNIVSLQLSLSSLSQHSS